MNKKKIFLIILAVVIVAGAVVGGIFISRAVEESKKNPFINIWHSQDGTADIQFMEDGTAKVTYKNVKIPVLNINYSGTTTATYAYDSKTEQLSLSVKIHSKEITTNYKYSIEDYVLTITDTTTQKVQTFNAEIIPEK